jgi:hypothetical protein
MENRLLILKDKKLEIFVHFNIRPSKKALELFDSLVDSGEFIRVIRWAKKVTNNSLGLKYLKEYFERLLQEEGHFI